jgi:hypothetical protein
MILLCSLKRASKKYGSPLWHAFMLQDGYAISLYAVNFGLQESSQADNPFFTTRDLDVLINAKPARENLTGSVFQIPSPVLVVVSY